MSEQREDGDKTEEKEESKMEFTLSELLNLEEELEKENAAVLGGSDEKCCTYTTGYIKRQALYSCLTCCPECKDDISKAAGICLACSYKCHENHELIELYTKRNFKCDCPTKKLDDTKCYFTTESNEIPSTSSSDNVKYDVNSLNQYNHNFAGLYCTCKRPYPDPDDPISDEMIQCIICEDWYHTRHLQSEVIPKTNEYSEMICGDCIKKNSFLKCYLDLATNLNLGKPENGNNSSGSLNVSVEINEETKIDENKSTNNINEENYESPRKKLKLEDENSDACKKPNKEVDGYKEGAVFWGDSWRYFLCTCVNCKKMYAESKVSFLLDAEDTVLVYEEKGLKRYHDTYNDFVKNALSSLGHTQKIDFINGFNEFKEKLADFFNRFSEESKVVTETDVKNFFKKLHTEREEEINQAKQPFFFR